MEVTNINPPRITTEPLLKWKPVDCWVETNSIGDFFFDSLKEKYKGKLSSVGDC